MKNVLFVCPTQYGYNTDYYKYCEKLSEKYNVFYVGIELGNSYRFEIDSKVTVFNVDHRQYGCGVLSMWMKVRNLKKEYKFSKVIVYYCLFISLFLFLFRRDSIIVDIRTAYIGVGIKPRLLNKLLSFETNFFSYISVISDGIISFLKLNKQKCLLLPLGADPINRKKRDFNTINLMYVGTFNDRNIAVTIDGFLSFINKTGIKTIYYYIIGVGKEIEITRIKKAFENKLFSDQVIFVGEARGDKLRSYQDICNVGVSYIPLRDYYENQPPTKTYEYLLNSMPVIATPNLENKKLLTPTSGILMKGDLAEDFEDALKRLIECKFDTIQIFDQYQCYTWDYLTKQYLVPIIEI